MEVEVAVETERFVGTVFIGEARHVVRRGMRGQVSNVLSRHAGTNAPHAFTVLVGWLWVKGNAFKVLAALVAGEAVGVEAEPCC